MPPAGPCWPSAPVLAPTPIFQKKEHDLPDKKQVLQFAPHSRTHAQTRSKRTHIHTHTHTHTHKPTEKCNRAHARTHICTQQLLGHVPCAQVALHKCFVQLALCKLRCAKCSVQVALRELRCGSCSASCSAQAALRKLLGASCSAQVLQLELQECTPRTTLVILELEVRKCTPRTTFALEICDFQLELRAARAAADQAGIAPATARHRRAAAQTTRQLPKTNSQAKNTQKKETTPEDYVCYFYVVPHASQTSGFRCVEKELLQLLLQAELRIILVTAPVRAVWLPITRRSQSVCAARSRRLPLASAWRLRKLRGTRARATSWTMLAISTCPRTHTHFPEKRT